MKNSQDTPIIILCVFALLAIVLGLSPTPEEIEEARDPAEECYNRCLGSMFDKHGLDNYPADKCLCAQKCNVVEAPLICAASSSSQL